MHRRSPEVRMRMHLLATLCLSSLPAAQDLIAVDYSGMMYHVDSHTAAATPIGLGQPGANALALDPAGVYWVRCQGAPVIPIDYCLARLDPRTGAATIVHHGMPDLRALAAGDGTTLWGVAWHPTYEALVRIDSASGS